VLPRGPARPPARSSRPCCLHRRCADRRVARRMRSVRERLTTPASILDDVEGPGPWQADRHRDQSLYVGHATICQWARWKWRTRRSFGCGARWIGCGRRTAACRGCWTCAVRTRLRHRSNCPPLIDALVGAQRRPQTSSPGLLAPPAIDRVFRHEIRARFGRVVTGSEEELSNFFDWFIQEHRLHSGRTITEAFADSKPDLSRLLSRQVGFPAVAMRVPAGARTRRYDVSATVVYASRPFGGRTRSI
jgi:hypothetical protein